MLEASKQLQLEAHLALEPQGDVADETVTNSGTEDADDIEENGSDGAEEDKSNEGKSLSKSPRKCLRRKACEAQLRKDLERLSKGAKLDTSRKAKRPKWTHHDK